MPDTNPLIAIFDNVDRTAAALRSLTNLRVAGVRVVSPAAYPVLAMTNDPGPCRLMGRLALAGAIVGLVVAIVLEVGSSLAYPIDVGGKPVVAWIPYVVVMFELTMMGAGVTSFLSLVILAVRVRRRIPAAARRAVASDRLVIVLPRPVDDDLRESIRVALSGAVRLEGSL